MEKSPTLTESPTNKYYPNHRHRLPAGPGRPKGSKDRWRTDAKWQIDELFHLAGGVEAAAKWAKKHPSEFYPLYFRCRVPKPLELHEDDNQITLIIQQGLTASAPIALPPPIDTTTGSGKAAAAEETDIEHE